MVDPVEGRLTPGTGPDLLRVDLAGESVELAAILHHLVPGSADVRALLVLQHERRDARVNAGRPSDAPRSGSNAVAKR